MNKTEEAVSMIESILNSIYIAGYPETVKLLKAVIDLLQEPKEEEPVDNIYCECMDGPIYHRPNYHQRGLTQGKPPVSVVSELKELNERLNREDDRGLEIDITDLIKLVDILIAKELRL